MRNKFVGTPSSATTLVLFRLNQNTICRLDFDSLTTFLQSDICKISIDDDSFFSKIQKGKLRRLQLQSSHDMYFGEPISAHDLKISIESEMTTFDIQLQFLSV